MKHIFIETNYGEGIILPNECAQYLHRMDTVKFEGYDSERKYYITDKAMPILYIDSSNIVSEEKKTDE
jgi:hypothetical protein